MLDNRPTLEETMRQEAAEYLAAVTRQADARKRQTAIENDIRKAESATVAARMKLAEHVGRNIRDRYIAVNGRVVHVKYAGDGDKKDAYVTVGELL